MRGWKGENGDIDNDIDDDDTRRLFAACQHATPNHLFFFFRDRVGDGPLFFFRPGTITSAQIYRQDAPPFSSSYSNDNTTQPSYVPGGFSLTARRLVLYAFYYWLISSDALHGGPALSIPYGLGTFYLLFFVIPMAVVPPLLEDAAFGFIRFNWLFATASRHIPLFGLFIS